MLYIILIYTHMCICMHPLKGEQLHRNCQNLVCAYLTILLLGNISRKHSTYRHNIQVQS